MIHTHHITIFTTALLYAAFCVGCGHFVHDGEPAPGAVSLSDAINSMTPMPPGVSGSVDTENDRPEETNADDVRRFSPDGEPLIRSGYVLRVTVVVGDKTEVAKDVTVSERNEITLPLINNVNCYDLTLNGLRSTLKTRYSEFFRDPEVNATFIIGNGISPYGAVLVQGCVGREGWYSIPPTRDLTVSRAIQLAGGFRASAKKSSVRVHRKAADGTIQRLTADIYSVGKKGSLEKDLVLKPNDVVYVDESSI